MLGYEILPWQQHIADIALELDPDGSPHYSQITLVVPRQCGKTQLSLWLMLHRALMWGKPQRIAYTAQAGKYADEKILQDYAPVIERSSASIALKQIVRARGSAELIFQNGSRITPFPNTPNAGHGKTIDLTFIDEARFDEDSTREQAFSPAMITRHDSQLWIVSAAGDYKGIYLRKKVEDGRRLIESGEDTGRAYFEYSAPDDADIDDPATWYATIPSLGTELISERSIRSELEKARAQNEENVFRQEYLCQWRMTEDAAIPAKYIARNLDAKATPTGALTFACDVALDRSWAAIAVSDASGNVELIEHREGASWVVDRLLDLWRKHRGAIVVDGYSPANSYVDRLETGGIPVVRYALRDMTAACGIFYDAFLDDAIKVRPNAALEAALHGAKKKAMSSGWIWQRVTDPNGGADLTPIFAATIAFHHATNRKTNDKPRSRIF